MVSNPVGIYLNELDVSQFVSSNTSLRPGIVLYSSWGPDNEVITISSPGELLNIFGNIPSAAYKGMIGVKKFLKRASNIQVVRVKAAADAVATKFIKDASVANTLEINAKYTGATGNNITIEVVTGNDTKKQINVYLNGKLKESFKGLAKSALADKNSNYKAAINGVSEYIVVDADTASDANTNEPANIAQSALSGGTSSLPSKAEFVGSTSLQTGLQKFSSDSVIINVLLCPDAISLAAEADGKDVMKEIESIAAARKDLVGLVDIPVGKSVTDAKTFADTTAAYNSTYVACFWPHIQYYDSEFNGNAYVPASLQALYNFAVNDGIAYPWIASFGYQRGINDDAIGIEYNPSSAERLRLEESQINPIVFENQVGVVTLGNYTKYATEQATQSLNIRRMVLIAESSIKQGVKTLLAEPHDSTTWAKFTSIANAALEVIKQKRGISSYQVLCDATTNTSYYIDNSIMVATIKVVPIKAISVIDITVQLTSSGVTFDN